uniref:Nuclear receptor domain-containing protein n=1 Tax=Macrostomum lignano TaxID=282301 RepID=A0A1I8FCY4_9PLAT
PRLANAPCAALSIINGRVPASPADDSARPARPARLKARSRNDRGAGISSRKTPSPRPRLPPPGPCSVSSSTSCIGCGQYDSARMMWPASWSRRRARSSRLDGPGQRGDTKPRVDHSLLADLEGGAQQASVALRQLVSRATPPASRSRRCTAGRSRSPPWNNAGAALLAIRTKGSPGKPFGLQETRRAEVDELLTTRKLCRLSISPSAQKSLPRCHPARRAEHDGLLRPEFPMQHAGHTALLVACPFKQNSCDLDAQHQLKSIQPQKELHFKEEEEQQQQQQQQQHACQCTVCGDKALGYNFDAITCESCKAFFRRKCA